jgi:hypothetical protein
LISKAPRTLLHAEELGSSQRSSFFDAVVEDRDGWVGYEQIEREQGLATKRHFSGRLTHDDARMEALYFHALRFAASRQRDVGSV